MEFRDGNRIEKKWEEDSGTYSIYLSIYLYIQLQYIRYSIHLYIYNIYIRIEVIKY